MSFTTPLYQLTDFMRNKYKTLKSSLEKKSFLLCFAKESDSNLSLLNIKTTDISI